MQRQSSSSTVTVRRAPARSTDTAIHSPTFSEDSDHVDASGEPLVEDFHSLYVDHRPKSKRSSRNQAQLQSQPQPYHQEAVQSPYAELPTWPGYLAEDQPAEDHYDDYNDHQALPPPNLSRNSMNFPRASSSNFASSNGRQPKENASSSVVTTNGTNGLDHSSPESMRTEDTEARSYSAAALPPLQTRGYQDGPDQLELVKDDDPANFDLLAAPPEQVSGLYQLEKRAELLNSREHLRLIFADPKLLLRFTGFLNSHRPKSVRILIYYLDALKALRAIAYANAISDALDPLQEHGFTSSSPQPTTNNSLQEKADRAFEVLAREDLPAYIAFTWIQVVSISIQRRITGTLAPHLREASEGLAEVFCLSDPSRPDNPIVFASEEFNRTTQYGMNYSIGRNCRFLQGPRTDRNSVRRLAEACKAGREHSEVFVNYRRDGSPFMNLLMIAPLLDSRGVIRYFIGAQVDVSGLLKDSTDLEALQHLVERTNDPSLAAEEDRETSKDEFQSLSEMLNTTELGTVSKYGGRMHREQVDDSDADSIVSHRSHKPRLLLTDPSSEILERRTKTKEASLAAEDTRLNGRLQGVYQHYLLIRPAPSLRILFTSPSLRVPGILQSSFLSRIGGSSRVRADLSQALSEGRGVTAKIRWLTRADDQSNSEGRSRWIHCTPLLGHSGAVGVWMVVLVDEENSLPGSATNDVGKRRFRPAPPVSTVIGGKAYDGSAAARDRDRREVVGSSQYTGSAQAARMAAARPGGEDPRQTRVNGYAQSQNRSRTDLGGGDGGYRPDSQLSFALK